MVDLLSVAIEDGKLMGDSPGCGCCGGRYPITKQQLIEFIAGLKEELEKAEEILAQQE